MLIVAPSTVSIVSTVGSATVLNSTTWVKVVK